MTSNPWASNPAAITVGDLLQLAIDIYENMPESAQEYERDLMHPEDAWSAAAGLLAHAAAVRNIEWQKHRPSATTPTT